MRGGRREAKRIVRSFVAMLGGSAAKTELARGVFYAVGFAALSDIHADFVRKARGGVGEDGGRWPRLSPKTLAYSRRFGPGEKAALKRGAGLGRANRLAPGGKDGLLTAAQLKRWRKIYAGTLARLAMSKPLGEAKAIAAGHAWNVLKSEGAQTKLSVFGDRPHEPLRDTGILLNSLSPGQLVGTQYNKPGSEGGEYQVFDSLQNGIIVGTNVPYARSHNEGDPKRGIPERRFIPKPDRIPRVWLERWTEVGMQAVASGLGQALQQGGV